MDLSHYQIVDEQAEHDNAMVSATVCASRKDLSMALCDGWKAELPSASLTRRTVPCPQSEERVCEDGIDGTTCCSLSDSLTCVYVEFTYVCVCVCVCGVYA